MASNHRQLGERMGQRLPHSLWRNQPCPHLGLGPPPSRLGGNENLVPEPRSGWRCAARETAAGPAVLMAEVGNFS